jgi:hypothetical protein
MPLDRPISQLLSEARREWQSKPGADEGEITELCKLAPFELPKEYLDLLRFCNGGYGELDAPPLLLSLDSIEESVHYNEDESRKKFFRDFWFIGGNAGLEMIAFDLRGGPPWPIVMIDPIAGPESAEKIAENMADFIPKIGLASDRPRD